MESLTASTHNHTPDVFLQSVSLVLQVYSLPVCSANDYLPKYSKLTFYLSVYVSMVIGGHQFGCKISNSSGKIQLEKSQKEFEVTVHMKENIIIFNRCGIKYFPYNALMKS